MSRLPSLVTYATVLVAFLLRAYRLADNNVWWDEGWSVWLSQKDLAWIALRTASDEHPPLHYWVLHFWDALVGTQAFSGRYLSVAFGLLTVALLYRIGKRIAGARIGALAALLLAVARFHIWWSQDIKNYTPSIFFAFAAVWFALDLVTDSSSPGSPSTAHAFWRSFFNWSPNARSIVAYALFAALALWTHYLAALVLVSLNLYALVVVLRESVRVHHLSPVLWRWFAANVLAAALFAPWLYIYLSNASAWTAAPAFDFGFFLKLVATVLPLGVTTNIENFTAVTIAFTALAVLGCLAALPRLSKHAPPANAGRIGFFALVVALPPVLIYVLSLTPVSFFAPKIQPRYLLILLPAYVLLLSFGIAFLKRLSIVLGAAALALVLATSAWVLADYYAGRVLHDDYASLANTIDAFAQPGDLVLLDTDQEWPTFLYYLHAPLDWLGVPNGAPMTASTADSLAQRAEENHAGIWVVVIPDALATDPGHLIETRLARDLPKRYDRPLGDKRLALYDAAPRDLVHVPAQNLAPQVTRAAAVDQGLELLGFDLPVRQANIGDTLHIVTYWNARDARDLLICPAGFACGATHIPAGPRVRTATDFVVPPGANTVLDIRAGPVELAGVRAVPLAGPAPVTGIAHPLDYPFGNSIQLAGYDIAADSFRAGDTLPITLYWRANRSVETSYTAFVHVLGTQFNAAKGNLLWGQVDRVPRGGTYPTTAWPVGENVADDYTVPIDAGAPPGTYKIEVGLYDPATGVRLPVGGGGDSVVVTEVQIGP